MTTFAVRPALPEDRPLINRILTESWGETYVAASGRVYELTTLPAIVVVDADEGRRQGVEVGTIVGIATYEIVDRRIEVVSIDAVTRHGGIGSALLDAAAAVGRAHGAHTLWLVTTNDNLDALRFYQRRGLHIMEVRPGGVAASRQLKPSIPLIGAYGIPMRDEIVLGLEL